MGIQLKRSKTADLDTSYVLQQGQVGIEMPHDANTANQPFLFKIGDGATIWSALPYVVDPFQALMLNAVSGNSKISGDGLQITTTASDGKKITTTYSADMSQSETILTLTDGQVFATQTKHFDFNTGDITTEVTYN